MKKLVAVLCIALVLLGGYTLKLREDVRTARHIISMMNDADAKEMAALEKAPLFPVSK